MKPIIKVKLFDTFGDKVAELETEHVTKLYSLFKTCEFDYGVIRITYAKDMYNEATFKTKTECKVLASVFKEKPLLKFIYDKDL